MEKRFKLVKVFKPENGNGEHGEWHRQEIVVEEIDETVQYPNQLLLRLTGERAKNFNLKEGDEVEFLYSSRVRIFKSKKGTPDEHDAGMQENSCWKISKVSSTGEDTDKLPFE